MSTVFRRNLIWKFEPNESWRCRRRSIKVPEIGIAPERSSRDAAARRGPRHRLRRLSGGLGMGHEIPGSGLTGAVRWSRTSLVALRKGRMGEGSGRPLLRQGSIFVVLACTAALLAAPAPAQGPSPDPAPPRTAPKPESPVTKRQPPPPSTQPPSPPPATVQAVQPPAPATPVLPPPAFTPSPPPSPAPVQRTRAQTIERPAKKTAARRRTAKQTARKGAPSLPSATGGSSSPDSTLLIGGLALVVLVLGDTIFLAVSSRYLRPS